MQAAVRGDEIGLYQAIAVEKDAKLAVAGANAAIADLTATKPAVLVPHVLERQRQPRLPVLHDARGVQTRTVVSGDNFEIAVRLMRQRAERRVERILAIIGRDNNGDERRAAHDSTPLRRLTALRPPKRMRSR